MRSKIYSLFIIILLCLFINNAQAMSIIMYGENNDLNANGQVTYRIELSNITDEVVTLSYDADVFEDITSSDIKANDEVIYDQSNKTFKIDKTDNALIYITFKIKPNIVYSNNYAPIKLKTNKEEVSENIIITHEEEIKEPENSFFYNLKEKYPLLLTILVVIITSLIIIIIFSLIYKKKIIIFSSAIILIIVIPFTLLLMIAKENIEPGNTKEYKIVKEVRDNSPKEEDTPNNNEEENTFSDNVLTNNYIEENNYVADSNKENNFTFDNNPVENKPIEDNPVESKPIEDNPTVDNPNEENNNPVEEEETQITIDKVNYQNYNFIKNESTLIELTINGNYDGNIKYLKVKDELYPVTYLGENKYQASLPIPSKSGLSDIVISEIVLDNSKKIATNYKVKVDVLKEKPTMSNFLVKNDKELAEISFDINDNDKAFKNGLFKIIDSDNKIIASKNIKNGHNVFYVKLNDENDYQVQLDVNYDLDSNYFNSLTGDINKGNDLFTNDFTFKRDYNFIAKDIKLTNTVTDKTNLVLSFANDYPSYYDVSSVIIDDKEYHVTKNNNIYQVTLPKSSTKGLNTLNFSKVILTNKSSYDVDKKLTYTYLKNIPTINSIALKHDADSLTADFTITDDDEAITSLKAHLIKDNEVIASQNLAKDERTTTFSISESGDYQISLEAEYDLGDYQIRQLTKSSKEKYHVPIQASISNITPLQYVAKNTTYHVQLTVLSNTDEDVLSFTIANQKYNALKKNANEYEITLTSAKVSGLQELALTSINYQNESIEVNDVKISTYVLKSVPSISDVNVNSESEEVSFKLTDTDDAFINGKILINNDESKSITFTKDTTSISLASLNLDQFVDYNLTFIVEYDLSTSANLGQKEFGPYPFEIKRDYGFNLDSYQLINVDSNNINLEFVSTNNSNHKYFVKWVTINNKEYPVQYLADDNYHVVVPIKDISTSTRPVLLNLTKAKLDDDKEFTISSKSVRVFKVLPTASIESAIYEDEKNISIKYALNDYIDTVTKLYVKLIGPENEIVKELPLEDLKDVDNSFVITSDNPFKAGKYQVVITSTFDALDGQNHQEEKISTNEISVDVPIHASIDNITAPEYVQKNSSFSVNFAITSNTDSKLKAITIDGKDVPVNNEEVTLQADDVSENKTYQITKLIYADGEYNLEQTFSVYILKSSPTINDFKYDDLNNVITFNFNNSDNALISAGALIEIKNDSDFSYTTELQNGLNTINLTDNLSTNGKYYVSLNGTYDLDDVLDDTNMYPLQPLLQEEITFIKDYNLTFKIDKVDVTNGQSIDVKFTSTNESKYDVTKVIVESIGSALPNNDNTITIPYLSTENKTFKITKVILANNKELDVLDNNTFTVYLPAPTINISSFENVESLNNNIKVSYNIIGECTNISASLMVKELGSDNYDLVETKNDLSSNDTLSFTKDIFLAGDYKIVFHADYDIVDGLEHYNEELHSNEMSLQVPLIIKGISSNITSLNGHYPEKNSNVIINYQVDANTNTYFDAVDIDKYDYDTSASSLDVLPAKETVTKLSASKNSITVKAPAESGVVMYEITKLYYNNEEYSLDSIDIKNKREYIDVVKDEIRFKSVTYTDKYHNNMSVEIDFEVEDKDGLLSNCDESDNCSVSFLNTSDGSYAQGQLHSDAGEPEGVPSSKVKVKLGKNKVTFSGLKEMNIYKFLFNATYDLDTNLLNDILGGDANNHEHTDNHSVFYFLAKPSDIVFNNYQLLDEYDGKIDNLKVNQKFKLSFTTTFTGDRIEDNPTIKEITINGYRYKVNFADGVYTTEVIDKVFTSAGPNNLYIYGVLLTNDEGLEEYVYIKSENYSVTVED